MNFLNRKGMVWPHGLIEAVIFFGKKGWSVTGWYLKTPAKTYDLGRGEDQLDETMAQKKLDEVFDAWVQKESRNK